MSCIFYESPSSADINQLYQDLLFLGDDEFDDQFDNLLDDFPEVDLQKSPKKEKLELPESPQKALFEDFMF